MKLNQTLPDLFLGREVKNIVEMTDTESFMLWCKYEDDNIYSTERQGCGINVGFVKDDQDMPIFISVRFAKYKGVEILTWEATSQYVDHAVIQEWFKVHFPSANHSDTMNIHNVKL